MMLAVVIVAGIIFYEAFFLLKTLSSVQKMQALTAGSLAVVRSTTMSDEEKAAAMQKSSAEMLGAVFVTTAKILGAVAISGLFLYVVGMFRWSFDELVAYSIRPVPLVVLIVAITAYGYLRHGRKR